MRWFAAWLLVLVAVTFGEVWFIDAVIRYNDTIGWTGSAAALVGYAVAWPLLPSRHRSRR